jgi:hypothetical protein
MKSSVGRSGLSADKDRQDSLHNKVRRIGKLGHSIPPVVAVNISALMEILNQ